LAFLPSRPLADRPVPTRYYGAFQDGSLKYRGIECRRSDVPRFVAKMQLELLEDLGRHAADLDGYKAMMPEIQERLAEMEARLWRYDVPLDELAVRSRLSREPGEYKGNGASALAARQSQGAGMNLHAGQSLEYIIVD